jgi:hypothetical protein
MKLIGICKILLTNSIEVVGLLDIKKFVRDIFMFIIGIACIFALIITIRYIFRLDRFGSAKIDWDDCIKINNTLYVGDFNMTTIESALVGKKIGEVKFTANRNVGNPNYRFRNWDAAYLNVGTEIYSIPSNSNAIAVKVDGRYFLYVRDYENYYLYFKSNL